MQLRQTFDFAGDSESDDPNSRLRYIGANTAQGPNRIVVVDVVIAWVGAIMHMAGAVIFMGVGGVGDRTVKVDCSSSHLRRLRHEADHRRRMRSHGTDTLQKKCDCRQQHQSTAA
jgi:hypothetical protein